MAIISPVATSYEATADGDSTALPSGAVHRINSARLNGVKGRPDLIAIGTMVWLASDLMFFSGLFAAYFTIQNVTDAQAAATGGTPLFEWGHSLMNIPLTVINTTILVASSFTCQMGVFAAHRHQAGRTGSIFNLSKWGMREWYILTFVMGAIFIGGQTYEYATLISEGLTISSNPYGSVFYLATGFHGLHVTGGLIAFVFVLGRTYLARTFTHEQYVSAECVSYYWHFVDVVWVALFFVVYLLPFLTY